VRAVAIAVILLTTAAHATLSDPFLDTGFGKAVAGLQLAVTVPADGKEATFRVKNTGTRTVTFATFASCSGWAFSIAGGASPTQLDHQWGHWGYDPKEKGLAKPGHACTVNAPDKYRTVGPGDTIAIVVPFATAGEITKSTDRVFQGNALLLFKDRTPEAQLHSAVQTR
jgi:hypothetical protein